MTEPERVLIEEAQTITGLPVRTIQSLSIQGKIPSAAKLGRRWTYDRKRLRAWIAAQESISQRSAPRETARWSPTLALPPNSAELRERLEKAIREKLRGS